MEKDQSSPNGLVDPQPDIDQASSPCSTRSTPIPRTLTHHPNRSSPALSQLKPVSQRVPPLPTADDLELDKLRFIDSFFTPPVRHSCDSGPSQPGLEDDPVDRASEHSLEPLDCPPTTSQPALDRPSDSGHPSLDDPAMDPTVSPASVAPFHPPLGYPASQYYSHQPSYSISSNYSLPTQPYASSSQLHSSPSSASLGPAAPQPGHSPYYNQQRQYYPHPIHPHPSVALSQQVSQHYAPSSLGPSPYPPGAQSGYLDPYAAPHQRPYPYNPPQPQLLGSSLTRSGTSMSSFSSVSRPIPPYYQPRAPTTSPAKAGPTITKASIDEYRNRIKSDPDPEAHFNFAKFLIEAAKKLGQGAGAKGADEKAIKKYRDSLLSESLKLIKKLTSQGVGLGKPAYSDAQFFLANCLGNGSLGLSVDHEKAYNLYVQASKQNHPAATYRTAVCNELGAGTRKDPNRALLFYRKASALGDTSGMYKLGMILLNGLLGQQRNPKEALLWLKRAAQQADEDNPHALHELGQIYEKPPVVSTNPPTLLLQRDEEYARELYTQSAQLGYPPSQNKLGAAYEYGGLGCGIDPKKSIGWYTKAAEKGDAESELALSGWYLTGYEGILKQSDSEAYLWARRAANKGLPKAEYAVGYYSEVGIGVKSDLDEAKRWYMRAATNKNKRAMQRLTELKKLGSQKPGKKQVRPTRDQAASECVIS